MPRFTVQNLKEDVRDHFEAQADAEPGKFAAVNWGDLFGKVDGFLDKLAPLIPALAPPQYAALLQLVIAAVHGMNSGHEVVAE